MANRMPTWESRSRRQMPQPAPSVASLGPAPASAVAPPFAVAPERPRSKGRDDWPSGASETLPASDGARGRERTEGESGRERLLVDWDARGGLQDRGGLGERVGAAAAGSDGFPAAPAGPPAVVAGAAAAPERGGERKPPPERWKRLRKEDETLVSELAGLTGSSGRPGGSGGPPASPGKPDQFVSYIMLLCLALGIEIQNLMGTVLKPNSSKRTLFQKGKQQ